MWTIGELGETELGSRRGCRIEAVITHVGVHGFGEYWNTFLDAVGIMYRK